MGLFFRKDEHKEKAQQAAKAAASGQQEKLSDDLVTKFIQELLEFGIDGKGPIASATKLAEKSRAKEKNVEEAIEDVIGHHMKLTAGGGFLTGLGGFITLPVALPANILEFYLLTTRMTAAIAHLRGYDLSKDEVRSAVLLSLTGSKADDVLQKVGVGGSVITGRAANLALQKLPAAALMMVNKGIGFQLLRGASTKLLAKLGKGVPVVGGAIGAGMDGWMAKRIADHARKQFPQQ